MNTANNDTTDGFLSGNNIGGLGYGIGVSVGILLLITTITLASYFCTRNLQSPSSRLQSSSSRTRWRDSNSRIQNVVPQPPDDDVVVLAVDVGLDEATIAGYPKLLYSEAKLRGAHSTTASCCSICLADYKSSDKVRLLPDCGHMFHTKCIDPWLRAHPTCPVCRTSPLPTPMSTPLAEVVPLASRRD